MEIAVIAVNNNNGILFWSNRNFLSLSVAKVIQGSLVLSQDVAVKVVNSTFIVSCSDPHNSSVVVTWIGPRGPLDQYTRPQVQTGSGGTRILFNITTLDDGGKYICTTPEDDQAVFRLTVEGECWTILRNFNLG